MVPDVNEVTHITTSQVARKYALNPSTVRRWAIDGKLPCIITPGGHYRFNPAEIESALGITAQAQSA